MRGLLVLAGVIVLLAAVLVIAVLTGRTVQK